MVHVFAVILCIHVIYLAKPGTSLFSWHPTFMVLGFGFFMFEAILLFSPHSSLVSLRDRKSKVKYHWILQVLANVCIFLGFAAIYFNKNINGKPHFTSWHGTIGTFAVVMGAVQSICALSLLYINTRFLNPLGASLAVRKQLHAISGALAYSIGYVALVLSLYSNFVTKNTGEYSWYILFAFMTILASIVVNQVNEAYLVKKKR